MDPQTLQPFFDWLSAHPGWAGLIVFLIAMSESLVVVGLIVPGTMMIMGVGALIGAGVLPFWPMALWAFLGAVAGDGLSYWFGHHYQDGLRRFWPFNRKPQLLESGEEFFKKHGGKSILFGRFVGPVRPIIPAVAGMMNMPLGSFLSVNIVSGLAWAPVTLLPGVVLGASLSLAAAVAGRLAVFALLLIFAVWLLIWLTRHLFDFFSPRALSLLEALLAWGQRHRYLGSITLEVVDPEKPELKNLLILATLLILSAGLFVVLLGFLLSATGPLRIDQALYQFFQYLRVPLLDDIFVTIYLLSQPWLVALFVLVVFVMLLVRKQVVTARHWLGAAAFGVAAVLLISALPFVPDPPVGGDEWVDGFPPWPALLATTLIGFLAVISSRALRESYRWLPYTVGALLILGFSVAPVYLGASWPSEVITSIILGVIWVVIIGIAYRRHEQSIIQLRVPLLVGVSIWLTAGLLYATDAQHETLERFQVKVPTILLTEQQWLGGGWRDFAAYRFDIKGSEKQPMSVQWAASLDEIKTSLEGRGWIRSKTDGIATGLNWLAPDSTINVFPVLPRVHDGRYESLRMIYPLQNIDSQLVLRLWSGNAKIDNEALWLGTLSLETVQRPFGLISLPMLVPDEHGRSLEQLKKSLQGWHWQSVMRQQRRPGVSGETVLIYKK